MADVHTIKIRSYNMSRIRSKDTKPEMRVRRFLHKNGFRFRLHVKNLPGKPDLVLPKYKTVIFIHGCFWHGHANCKLFVMPKSNTDYWMKKVQSNIERDFKAEQLLAAAGWKIVKIWECELTKSKFEITTHSLINSINR